MVSGIPTGSFPKRGGVIDNEVGRNEGRGEEFCHEA